MPQLGDVYLEIPVNQIGVPAGANAFTRNAAGLYYLNLSAAATYTLAVPISSLLREQKQLPQAGGIGIQVKDLVLAYAPITSDLTSGPTVAFFTAPISSARSTASMIRNGHP